MEELPPLHIAAKVDDVVTIRRLAAEGADVNEQSATGARPLHAAAVSGHVDAARVLVEVGAELEASADNGYRSKPLHVAAYQGHVAVAKTLVDLGADVDATDAEGSTPLHWAAHQGHVEVVTSLVELGADIGALLNSGETPLQLSIREGHPHVARVLRGAEALQRSARTKKEAAAKEPTQEAIDQAERMGALVIEEEEREEAQRKVRDCSTLTLTELASWHPVG
jgi:ankyrin repeat protein